MKYRYLKTPEGEGIIWGLLVAILLTGSGTPPIFALVVGIIFCGVAVFVLGTKEGEILRQYCRYID
jgi:xanthosine utilization system XapX-like protein